MDVSEAIHGRRSIRAFKPDPVSQDLVSELLEAGRWAPSGLNNQPWRFHLVMEDSVKKALSEITQYGGIIISAPVSIAVFLDMDSSYDLHKDLMAIGACAQNILLRAYSLGLGAVWLGEILKNKDAAREILGAPMGYELCAIVSVGFPAEEASSDRKSLSELMF